MSQTNVSGGGTNRIIERDRSAEGFSMGMMLAIVLGVALLALVAWYTIFQSGWFGFAPSGTTNVNVTTNQPANPSDSTGSTSGSTSGR